MQTSTAGRIVTDHDLRTFSRCSELFSLGGSFPVPTQDKLAKQALEYAIAQSVRKAEPWPGFFVQGVAKAAADLKLHRDYLDGQVEIWQNRAILWQDEVAKLLSPSHYIPVMGPTPWRVKISNTPFEIKLSGVFRTNKNQVLHVLYYSPYGERHDKLNDPALPALLATMNTLLPSAGRKYNVLAHIVGIEENGGCHYTNLDAATAGKSAVARTTSIIKAMESGLHWPALPCPMSNCPVRHKCSLRGIQ